MPAPETNTREIIARLEREGWVSVGGAKHEKFRHPDKREPILVPRHRTVSFKVRLALPRRPDGDTEGG